jgi:hypothetical protein
MNIKNIFWEDKLNPKTYMFFDFIYVSWCRRSGKSWIFFAPNCFFILNHPNCPHIRGWYFHLDYFGGLIGYKSKKCYDNQ